MGNQYTRATQDSSVVSTQDRGRNTTQQVALRSSVPIYKVQVPNQRPIIRNFGVYVEGNIIVGQDLHFTTKFTDEVEESKTTRSWSTIPTRNFNGRQDILENIRHYFATLPRNTSNDWDRIVAIVGLAGTGKTETAYKFAQEFPQTFPYVACINAETEGSAVHSFLDLAKKLEIVRQDETRADLSLVNQVYREIDQRGYEGVVLIFDNAMQLNSDKTGFGVLEYFPTDYLANKRCPHIIITSRTEEWGSSIKSFPVGALSETDSVQFFREYFDVSSSECDEEFKILHELFEGYPLGMNLAASSIDYNRPDNSILELQQLVQAYVATFGQEDSTNQNEMFHQTTHSTERISTAWRLTSRRLQQAQNGPEALQLLQIMSVLHTPMQPDDIETIAISSSDCPHLNSKDQILLTSKRIQELSEVLDRFRILKVFYRPSGKREEKQISELRFHRLLQAVVRQHITDSTTLENILCYIARARNIYKFKVNESSLNEILEGNPLTPRMLTYLGILAWRGIRGACKIVDTRAPEGKCAETVWQLHNFKRGMQTMNDDAVRVLRELVELTSSEERLTDRQVFAEITLEVFLKSDLFEHFKDERNTVTTTYPDWWHLIDLELVIKTILNVCSVDDGGCDFPFCQETRSSLFENCTRLTIMLSELYFKEVSPNCVITADRLLDTWFAILGRLEQYSVEGDDMPFHWMKFWIGIDYECHSPQSSQHRIVELRTRMWDRGIVRELTRAFRFTSRVFQRRTFCLPDFGLVECMDFCLHGMDSSDERVQEVESAFFNMAKTVEKSLERHVDDHVWVEYAVGLCSILVNMLLRDGVTPVRSLKSLSCKKLLTWLESNRPDVVHEALEAFFTLRSGKHPIPKRYYSEYLPLFIQRYSSSEEKDIQTLVTFCRQINIEWSRGTDEEIH